MNLEQRIDLLTELGGYCISGAPALEEAKRRAHAENGWFTPEFTSLALRQIASEFLQKEKLLAWAAAYGLSDESAHHQPAQSATSRTGEPAISRSGEPASPRTIGLIMAGNIPLVGFHDFLAIFISGHRQLIKPSVRDQVLIRHLADWLTAASPAAARSVSHSPSAARSSSPSPAAAEWFGFAERLNGCDAYIATGSNNSARYFEYYFAKYPHIIRRNRTSVALLNGQETPQELEALADDVYQYFGLGCRNVTQLYVPEAYDFVPLLDAFRKYDRLADLARYKHNYDYQLTLLILNKKKYMANESILLTENDSPFSPISVLHYTYYRPGEAIPALAGDNPDIQCIVGQNVASSALPGQDSPSALGHLPSGPRNFASSVLPFGQAQRPSLTDYADGVDTLQFLRSL
jgi:hypothetical protein